MNDTTLEVQTITPIYTVGLDAGGKTWNVSDQFCVLYAGCTQQGDAERLKSLMTNLYLERQETMRFAGYRTELVAVLREIADAAGHLGNNVTPTMIERVARTAIAKATP